MPSVLVNDGRVSFICARDFVYAGVEYKMGDDFDQDLGMGRIDLLVRTRRLFAVVDSDRDRPRHWHHHVWERSVIEEKLGLVTGSSGYNKPAQGGPENLSKELEESPPDEGKMLHDQAHANAMTEQVLEQENEEGKYSEENEYIDPESGEEETEPDELVHPTEVDEVEDERVIDEDDLYDPSDYNAPEVIEYLESDITDEERQRVLAVEAANKGRKGILNHG